MRQNPFRAMPEQVMINGESYDINSDYRVGVAIEIEYAEKTPDIMGLLSLFYKGKIPPDIGAAVESLIWFYANHDAMTDKPRDSGKSGRWYDFGQDADALLASFLGAYGIDLSTAKLHWWAFRRLMMNLPPETPFMRRVRYRTADLNKLSKEERKHYKKMRALYAIKRSATPTMTLEERDAALKEKARRRFEEAQKQMEAKANH